MKLSSHQPLVMMFLMNMIKNERGIILFKIGQEVGINIIPRRHLKVRQKGLSQR